MAGKSIPLPPKLQLLAFVGKLALVAGFFLAFIGPALVPWHLVPPALYGLLRGSVLIPLGVALLLPGWIWRMRRLMQGLQEAGAQLGKAGQPGRAGKPSASELPDLDRVLQLATRLQQQNAGGQSREGRTPVAASTSKSVPAQREHTEQSAVRGRNTRTPLIRR